MPGWYIIQNEDKTQDKSDVQKSPVLKPQVSTVKTEQNNQLPTSDPTNWWITPVKDLWTPLSEWEISNVNKELKLWEAYTWNDLGSIYWLNTSWYLPSQKIDEMAEYKAVWDSIYKKQVISVWLTETEKPKYQEFIKDLSLISESKQWKTSVWLDINFWPSAENTIKIAEALLWSKDIISNKDLNSSWSIESAQRYYEEVSKIFSQYWNNSDELRIQLQWPLWELKKSLEPIVKKASWMASYLWIDSTIKWVLDSYWNDMRKFNLYYNNSWSDIIKMKDSLDNTMRKYSISYQDTKGWGTSKMAKQKLNNNAYYQTFLNDVYKNNPMLRWAIDKFKSSDVVSWDENKFIKKYFLWPQWYENLKTAKAEAYKHIDSFTVNKMFAPFKDILSVWNLYYETEYDDLVEQNFQVEWSYSQIQNTIDYNIDYWNMFPDDF